MIVMRPHEVCSVGFRFVSFNGPEEHVDGGEVLVHHGGALLRVGEEGAQGIESLLDLLLGVVGVEVALHEAGHRLAERALVGRGRTGSVEDGGVA